MIRGSRERCAAAGLYRSCGRRWSIEVSPLHPIASHRGGIVMLPKSLIALCAAALLLGACESTPQPVSAPPPPPPAAAPSYMVFFDWDRSDLQTAAWDPKAYCKALSDKYREYRTAQVTSIEATAIAKCEAGDYATGIPILEDSLITAKMPLPNPGYRWPGRPV